jgi:predicted ferric reductase
VTASLWLWYASRIAALGAFFVLAASLLTGMAIRTAYLSALARNRAVVSLHGFLTWFWVPLVAVHVTALLLDATARIRVIDVVVPFQVGYVPGSQLAIGLGTIGLLLLVMVGVTSALRRRMSHRLWLWIHRCGYAMFALFVFHAQLAGTDFSRTAVSLAGWATLGALVMLSLPRIAGARLAAGAPDRVGAGLAAAAAAGTARSSSSGTQVS